jgi:hypothetical protein
MITKKQIEFVATVLGWRIDWIEDNTLEFSQHTPAGQECVVSIAYNSVSEIPSKVEEYYESYDPSYEAYIWLGQDGHGKNGAPDNMGDVYADAVEAEQMIGTLSNALNRMP